jgi:hypothetical protein
MHSSFPQLSVDENTSGSGLNGSKHYQIKSPLHFPLNQICSVIAIPKYLNCATIFKGSLHCILVTIQQHLSFLHLLRDQPPY